MTDHSLIQTMARDAWPEAYMVSLRADENRRPFLWGLISYLDALSSIDIYVREPTLRLIRLRWWRDHLGQAVQGHPVLQTLSAYPEYITQLDALAEAHEEPSVKIDRIFWSLFSDVDTLPEAFVDNIAAARQAWTKKGNYAITETASKIDVKALPKLLRSLGKVLCKSPDGNPHWRKVRLLLG